jgi:hypothetical protein
MVIHSLMTSHEMSTYDVRTKCVVQMWTNEVKQLRERCCSDIRKCFGSTQESTKCSTTRNMTFKNDASDVDEHDEPWIQWYVAVF